MNHFILFKQWKRPFNLLCSQTQKRTGIALELIHMRDSEIDINYDFSVLFLARCFPNDRKVREAIIHEDANAKFIHDFNDWKNHLRIAIYYEIDLHAFESF